MDILSALAWAAAALPEGTRAAVVIVLVRRPYHSARSCLPLVYGSLFCPWRAPVAMVRPFGGLRRAATSIHRWCADMPRSCALRRSVRTSHCPELLKPSVTWP